MELALPVSTPGSLIERVTDTVKSLSDNIPLLVGVAGDVPANTKRLHFDIQAYKQSIENEHIQAEHEVAKARAEHVTETSSTTHEVSDLESTTRVTKTTRRVVQTVTATKTRIMGVGPITPDMVNSIDEMFQKVPLLNNTIFSWSMERGSDANAITITQRILRPQALGSNVETQSYTTSPHGISTSRSLIFIPREAIPYRQLTEETSAPESKGDQRAATSTTDTPKSERATGTQVSSQAPKQADFVLEIKRKEGLRTLWQETAPIKMNRVADRLSRVEVELQENLFELLTSEASYAQSLSIVLKHLFNVDCVRSSEVVVRSDRDSPPTNATPLSNMLAHGAALSVGGPKAPHVVDCDATSSHVAVELEKLVKPLDRKALHLNLDELHRNSISLLDALKKCWIAESCLMKANFVQLLADRLGDTAFRAAYLAYLRDVRYQQELLRDLVSCRRVADASSPTNASPPVPGDAAGPGAADSDDHLCIAERYSRVELERIRALLAEFHTLKCVENRALQSFLLLPLERLTKLKMCLESCEKLARKLVGNGAVPVVNGQPMKELNQCALVQFGIDLDELRRILSTSLASCCSLLDESNRLTYTCMQAEAQLQLDRLVRFEPVFGLHRISLVRTDRLFLKDDCGSLLRFLDARIAADREPSRKMSKAASASSAALRTDSLPVRLFLFSDLLLLTTDSQRREEAFAHFGLATSTSRDAKGGASFIGRLRKSMSRKHSVAARRAVNGPGGKFACGTADLAHAISGTGSITVLDYAVISQRTVRVALVDTSQPLATQYYPSSNPSPATTPTSPSDAQPAGDSNKPVRSDSARLHRSKSTGVPAYVATTDKQRRSSSLGRAKSAVRNDGQPADLDSAILTFCEQQKAGHSHADSNVVQNGNGNGNGSSGRASSSNLLRVTLHENGRGERADYVFRFTNESDAPRWFDALALAIRNRLAEQPQTDAGDAADAQLKHDALGNRSNVLRPHCASYGEELELAKGDVVVVQKRTADGWCKGTLLDGSRSGWFRSFCIE